MSFFCFSVVFFFFFFIFVCLSLFFFFFSSRRRHTRSKRDWSSDVCSSDLVATFPQGLETVIGERGITLSGGQKQRTAIARALVRDPLILLLDDALSAVDTQTEERILRALREIRKGRTVLIVSHRVSSVKDADHIVVLDDGRIVERGTHESLVAHDGYYAELYRKQTLEEEIEEIAEVLGL